jgi:HD superfamily phosphohydrolase
MASTDELIAALEIIYKKDRNLAAAWEHEENRIAVILSQVAESISFNYDLERPLGVGGSGIVIAVTDRNLSAKRALKIARPSPGKEKLLTYVLTAETEHLKRLSHQHLIRIFAQGAAAVDKDRFPYYIMEFVDGAKDSDKYLMEAGLRESDLIRIFRGVLEAVVYMHSQEEIHMDIKPGNVLVTPTGIPIISDLGFAKHITLRSGYTLIGGTQGYIHPEALRFVEEVESDPNRLRGEALRTALHTTWDLYSLGKTFLRLLDCFIESHPKVLSPYSQRYLRLLACRLLDGYNSPTERALGLPVETLKEIKYRQAHEALEDLDKLSGAYSLPSKVPELNSYIEDTIQVSALSPTPFTPRVRKLISHPAMLRLASCTQLGLLNLIYPTATHTRMEHSLGTFSVLCRYILALYHDPLNPLFRQLMTAEDLRAALLAALLHDIGQYPLAHDLEEAEPEIFSHLIIGERLLSDPDSEFRKIIEDAEPESWNVPVGKVLGILQARPEMMDGTLKDRMLHSLIDGPIDADKLDYLHRDSRHLGLAYGDAIDFERLLRVLTIVFRDVNNESETYVSLGIHEKGKITAESLAFARYAMFGQVYWHHAYRSIKVMIHRMVWEMLDKLPEEAVRDQFREFVAASTEPHHVQRSLFTVNSDQGRSVSFPYSGLQIQESDFAVLRWISARSGPRGESLFGLLSRRLIYKRILVLSLERTADKQLWIGLSKFYGSNRERWDKKLLLQREFQKRVRGLLDKPHSELPQSAVLTSDAHVKCLNALADDRVALLVDFPPERRGSETELEYIVEGDRRRTKADEMKTGSLEHSIVWQTLRDKFHESIGKVRVYCHPDHSDFLTASLTPKQIEDALGEALKVARK